MIHHLCFEQRAPDQSDAGGLDSAFVNVCIGSLADIRERIRDGRFTLKSGHGLDREFANGIANELRGTGRYQGLQGGIAIQKLANQTTRLGTGRHTPA